MRPRHSGILMLFMAIAIFGCCSFLGFEYWKLSSEELGENSNKYQGGSEYRLLGRRFSIPKDIRIVKIEEANNLNKTGNEVSKQRWFQRMKQLQKRLNTTLAALREDLTLNRTRVHELRNKFNENANGSYFILTKKNSPLRTKFYNTFNEETLTINKYRQVSLPEVSPFSHTYRTCSVVGNVGILNGSECGRQIDSSQFVMRTNIQAILQFQHDAGRRSNLTTMNPDCWERFGLLTSKRNKSIMFLNAMKEYEGYMMWVPNSPRIPNQFAFTTHELLRESTNVTLLIANAKYFEHIQQLWKLKKPLSPGMMLVAMAISLCDELHLYGFWPFTVVDANGLHLHNDNSDDKYWSAFHSFSDYSAEFRLLASLHKQGLFKLHVDKCS